jgi:sulfatase modifying factor 1
MSIPTNTRLACLLLIAAVQFSLALDSSSAGAEAVESFRDCEDCPEMIRVPSGSFEMGSSAEALMEAQVPEPFAAYQTPQHAVRLARPFAIGKYPVTRAQFEHFVLATDHQTADLCWSWNVKAERYEQQQQLTWRNPGFPQSPSDPAVCISWDDAKAYVAWLSQVTNKTYRLPSESEREYVTRGGSETAWPWGDTTNAICEHANVSDRSRLAVHRLTRQTRETAFDCEDGFVYTAPVGSFAPNIYGVYDTLGNVWEWIEDCFAENYETAPSDSTAVQSNNCAQRTLRGGSWFTFTFLDRPGARYGAMPTDRSGHVGFRIARPLD